MSSELARIARLAARFGGPSPDGTSGARSAWPTPRVELGIGDDAAVLAPPPGFTAGERLVWTIDAQVDGVHFRPEWLSGWFDAGWRSFMAAASDLAAMGALPWCALGALELPDSIDDGALDEIARGQRAASDAVGAPIVGGNLARAGALAITTTLLGACATPVTRGGARAGDALWIAGPVGLAAAGLRALARGVRDARLDDAIRAWRAPTARIADGRAMGAVARAAIDVSDGLARDLAHVALASGVRAVVDAELLAAHTGEALARAAEALGESALDLALHGGEDYALVAASEREIPGFSRIGELREGAGLALRTRAGESDLAPRGFDHFT